MLPGSDKAPGVNAAMGGNAAMNCMSEAGSTAGVFVIKPTSRVNGMLVCVVCIKAIAGVLAADETVQIMAAAIAKCFPRCVM